MLMENPINPEIIKEEEIRKTNEFLDTETEKHIAKYGYSAKTATIDDPEERKAAEVREKANLREALLLEKQNLESELREPGDKEKKIQEIQDNIEAAKKVLENGKSEADERENAKHSIEVLERQKRILENLF